MPTWKATAYANPNLALIKYWGNRNDQLRLPANASLSMNLDGLYTQTTVTWDETLVADQLILNAREAHDAALIRVSVHLDILRKRLGIKTHAKVVSENNFPMGTGIASSASSFAALTVAGLAAAGAQLTEREQTTLARLGSGSAARSIPTGFVEWHTGETHEASYAESIAAPEYWDLVDVVAIVSNQHKEVGSREGHQSASTSDLQAARVAGADERLHICKTALLNRDFAQLADVVEHESNLMHAVMMTSRPPLFYWLPPTLSLMSYVRQWRSEGLGVCYTLDAGPNVHCICVREAAQVVSERLRGLSEVHDVRIAAVGRGAQVLESA